MFADGLGKWEFNTHSARSSPVWLVRFTYTIERLISKRQLAHLTEEGGKRV